MSPKTPPQNHLKTKKKTPKYKLKKNKKNSKKYSSKYSKLSKQSKKFSAKKKKKILTSPLIPENEGEGKLKSINGELFNELYRILFRRNSKIKKKTKVEIINNFLKIIKTEEDEEDENEILRFFTNKSPRFK